MIGDSVLGAVYFGGVFLPNASSDPETLTAEKGTA
jgi:hypothetical protein